ncbi:MAG: saccharopine dehydrogenase [Neisseriaceae bacterium]|nr:MAG: saccharopine dehydrogenase [Neisseriaceae bacterium]
MKKKDRKRLKLEKKKNVLIVGAGGVGHVVAHKCAQNNDILGQISIASRHIEKCYAIADSVSKKNNFKIPSSIHCYEVDAMDIDELANLIEETKSKIVINVGSAFINLYVLQACIKTGASYIDTAIHENPNHVCETPPWYDNYEWQWKEVCQEQNVTAILGCGFDPGVVNAYSALAVNEYLDETNSLDIIDINAGKHGHYFATNFDPEINFREFTGTVWTWQNSEWVNNKMFEIKRTDDLPIVGNQDSYLTGHDEIHSMSQTLGVPNIRFWMGFSAHYMNVFMVLKSLGLLSERKIKTAEGLEVVPLKVVKAVLPDPASLAVSYTGNTLIGVLAKGQKYRQDKEVFIYNVCNHEQTYQEVGSQAISYTAGVPAVAAAILIATKVWKVGKMVNVEELNPKPFINLLNKMGLPSRIRDEDKDVVLEFQ